MAEVQTTTSEFLCDCCNTSMGNTPVKNSPSISGKLSWVFDYAPYSRTIEHLCKDCTDALSKLFNYPAEQWRRN